MHRMAWKSVLGGAACGLLMALTGSAMADEFMDQVKAEVVKFAGPQSDWRGPTASPKPDSGKKVAYMSTDEQNDA